MVLLDWVHVLEGFVAVSDLVHGLEGHLVVLDLVPDMEGIVVGLGLVSHLENFVLALVVHVVWPLGLVAPEGLAVEGQALQSSLVYVLYAVLVHVVLYLP